MFSCKIIANFLKTLFFIEYLCWLLLEAVLRKLLRGYNVVFNKEDFNEEVNEEEDIEKEEDKLSLKKL